MRGEPGPNAHGAAPGGPVEPAPAGAAGGGQGES